MARLLVCVVVVVCFSPCDAGVRKKSNDELEFSNLTAVDIKSTLNKEFDAKGLQPWYDVAKSFVHTVQKDDLPYGDVKGNDDFEFKQDKFLKGWELPFLVVFAIGFLFAIIMPIVGCCFCCCRCCGNCGGEMVQRQTDRDGVKRLVFAVALFIITILMFTGCLMAFVSNDRITDTVKSYRETPINAIKDVEKYFNETLNLVTGTLISDVLDVLNIVANDILTLPSDISSEVKTGLNESVREPLNKVVQLAQNTSQMEVLLSSVKNKTEELRSKSNDLGKNLTKISDDLNSTCSLGNCSGIDYEDALKQEANFTALPDVTQELQNISDVVDTDLLERALDGLKEFDTVNKTIREKTNDTVQDINKEIKDARNEFEDNIRKDIVDKVNEVVLSNTDNWIDDINKAFDDYVEPNDKYRYYAGVGLTCLVLLPVVLMALGLLCGIFGHDKDVGPTERGTLSHMGGNSLMAAVGFMFIFVFYLMLFTAFSFIVGSNVEKVCSSVRDESFYTDFLDQPRYWNDEYLLGDKVLNNKSLDLTVKSILTSCRNNDPLFKAIQGYKKWNLTDKFSVRDKLGDFEEDLKNFDVSIENQTVLNDDTKKGLQDLRDSGVDNINFEKFFNETQKDIVRDIDGLRTNITIAANKSSEPAKSNLTRIAKRLEEIQKEANEIRTLANSLEKDVGELERLGGNIKVLANATLVESEKASQNFKQKANGFVKKAVTMYSDRLLGYVDQAGAYSVKLIEEDLGRCKILTDVYDATINLVCRETIFPFNGFWFALGFCLFFYIPAIILSVKLAKHYRRMRFEEGFDRHDGLEMTHVSDRNKPWLNQGNAVYPK